MGHLITILIKKLVVDFFNALLGEFTPTPTPTPTPTYGI